jgi:hypothetical protein
MAEYFSSIGKSRKTLAQTLLFLLIGVIILGGLINTGSLSFSRGGNMWYTVIPMFIFIYLLLIATFTFSGLKLDLTDLIIIPTIGAAVIIFVLNIFVAPSFVEPESEFEGEPDDLVDIELTDTINETETEGVTVTEQTTLPDRAPSDVQELISTEHIIILFFLTIILGLIFYYFYLKLSGDDLRVTMIEKEIYKKSYSEKQRSIINLYIKSSLEIEKVYGSAPRWYSPTFFSKLIDSKTTRTLASYFYHLTVLYEKARFTQHEINETDLKEAEELQQQISIELNQYIKELTKKELEAYG